MATAPTTSAVMVNRPSNASPTFATRAGTVLIVRARGSSFASSSSQKSGVDTVAPRTARALELHYFAGMSYDEVADALDVSPATIDRELRFGKSWLKSALAP